MYCQSHSNGIKPKACRTISYSGSSRPRSTGTVQCVAPGCKGNDMLLDRKNILCVFSRLQQCSQRVHM
ncbi:hypothetical protein MPTK1_3g20460 [Marchantia polymorpha subsp. ruderalis]|uniref:Uncharacterized protein n=2 Tax=Marchantia polymorpha TaxID=3197 RepID=A0AAF6B2X5_MARPO|nr:hypothetical protein MARPO_0149s0011 [Marchantia polymorpha]BBN06359.1 hypothetical protein Mp_3g20460 [Marchantia polymorpha subsp. ruderalis]|eukprot:PTQ29014.1 hypothetical protein MARPO_0149s0011 [Marchantia polymorpha]